MSPGGKIALRVKVVGNFYGEKQGPKIWNDQLDSILVNMGFIRCPVMPCLYYKYDGDDIIFIAVHVDDGLVVTNNTSSLDKFMKLFLTYVRKAEMLKEFCKYIGIDCVFIPKLHHVVLDQTINIENYFHDFNKRVDTPMMSTTNLRTAKPNTNNESLLPITGRLRYLADRTKPDILVATGEISTGGAKDPSDEHLKTALRTMDYLTTTSDLGLTLGGEGDFVIFAYVDASYITDGNAKSRLGGCVFLGYDCGAVMCFSRNDTIKSTISHSSTESEIRAIDVLLRELIHIIEICLFLSINFNKTVEIFCDNKSAIMLCSTLRSNHKTKHINMLISFIREKINDKTIELHFIPSKCNVADILTKPLAKDLFLRHREILLKGHNGIKPSDMFETALVVTSIVCDDV